MEGSGTSGADEFNGTEGSAHDHEGGLSALAQAKQAKLLKAFADGSDNSATLEAFFAFQNLAPKHQTGELWQAAIAGMVRIAAGRGLHSKMALETMARLAPEERKLFCIGLLGSHSPDAVSRGIDFFSGMPCELQESEPVLRALEKRIAELFKRTDRNDNIVEKAQEFCLSSGSYKARLRLAATFFAAKCEYNNGEIQLDVDTWLTGMDLLASLGDDKLVKTARASMGSIIHRLSNHGLDHLFSSIGKLAPRHQRLFLLDAFKSGEAADRSFDLFLKLPLEFKDDRLSLAALSDAEHMIDSESYHPEKFAKLLLGFPPKFRGFVFSHGIKKELDFGMEHLNSRYFTDEDIKRVLGKISGFPGEDVPKEMADGFAELYSACNSKPNILKALAKFPRIRNHPLLEKEKLAYEKAVQKKKDAREKAERKRLAKMERERLEGLMERYCADLSDFGIGAATILDFCRLYSLLGDDMRKQVDDNMTAFFVLRSKKDVNALVSCAIGVSEKAEAWPILIKLLEMAALLGKASLDCGSLALAARAVANEGDGSERLAQFSEVVGRLAAAKKVEGLFTLEKELRGKDAKMLGVGEKALLRVLDRSPGLLSSDSKQQPLAAIRMLNGRHASPQETGAGSGRKEAMRN